MWRLIVCFLTLLNCTKSDFIYEFKTVTAYEIAGIFASYQDRQLNAFNESMRHSTSELVRVQPVILQPLRPDSYSMWRALCSNREMRPIAVIGPQNPISDGAVRDQCCIANIPHIQAAWQPLNLDLEEDLNEALGETEEEEEGGEEETEGENDEAGIDEEEQEENQEEDQNEEETEAPVPVYKNISINFYPDSDEINIAFARLLRYYNWESFAVVYEDELGLLRIQKILATYTDKFPVTVRKLDPDGDNSQVFKELKAYQDSRILMDCDAEKIPKYLDVAEAQHMVNHYQHYIFTSLDVWMVADNVINRTCNSTWLSMTDSDRPDLSARVGKWNGDGPVTTTHVLSIQDFPLEVLLMDDISNHVVHALKNIELPADSTAPVAPVCDEDAEPWEHGAKLQDLILTTRTGGITGNIEFDERGRRKNYALHVNEKSVNRMLQVVGRWESADGSAIINTRPTNETNDKDGPSKEFRVMSTINPPYFMCIREGCQEDEFGQKYKGFIVDLIEEIFIYLRKEKYNYSYKFVGDVDKPQGKYDNQTKKWGGMIGELLDKQIDLAACDFTITEERKKVVDFSVPFMSLGISILYVQEQKKAPSWFSFLNPYTVDVWLYAVTAYFAVSIVLFICARISPADWENPEPCDKDPEELENIWTFKNCAWLTMGSIMTQGCDILPKAIGTRWVCGMWWFFAVIFCQTYIAQLSASMTSARDIEPINSIEDLAKQNKIRYGAYRLGSTLEFFRISQDKMYQKMYETMMANEAVLVGNNNEGETRVKKGKGKYAFFMESSTIEYKLRRDCNLKKVGGELDSKDYGIAMPANSPFRTQINRAILSLKESTILGEIKRKWWEKGDGAKKCEETEVKDEVDGDLEFENLIGLFIVLVVGLFLSLIVTAAEFFNEIRNIVIKEKLSHKEALVQELKASLNLLQLEKPILKNPSRAPSIESSDSSEKKEKRNALLENFMEFEKEAQ